MKNQLDIDINNCPSETKANHINCAKVLVDTLSNLGVSAIFGYPGAAVLSVYNELSKTETIKHILVRHEQAAVHMAEGYAKVSGQPGVVLVTSGPGFTNTITGIANAYADSTPLVILAGDVSSNNNTGKAFQKVDIISMTKTCCKKNYYVSSKEDIKHVLEDAFEVAVSGDKGPVVVVLPRNILESKYISKYSKDLYRKKSPVVSEFEYEKVISLLNSAEKPIILLGGGAVNAVENIKYFAETTKIPVVSTLMGIGVFPSEHNLYLGMLGMNGTSSANIAIENADLIIALGVSFSERSTCRNSDFAQFAKIVSINTKHISNEFDIEILSDSDAFLNGLLKHKDLIDVQNIDAWKNAVNIYKKSNVLQRDSKDCLNSSGVLKTIYEYTRDLSPVVVTDVGQHQLLTAQYFNFNKPKKLITSGGLGTMGFGLPAAIGAYIANPEQLVLNITGDGSFQMNLQELATCREHNIPIKIIIMNNGYLGMVRQLQQKNYNNTYQVKMTNPDFTKIAEAYDLFAVRVTKYSELLSGLEKSLLHKGTAIIDIAIDSYEEV